MTGTGPHIKIGRKGAKVHAPAQPDNPASNRPLCNTGENRLVSMPLAFIRRTAQPVTCKVCLAMLTRGQSKTPVKRELYADDD